MLLCTFYKFEYYGCPVKRFMHEKVLPDSHNLKSIIDIKARNTAAQQNEYC